MSEMRDGAAIATGVLVVGLAACGLAILPGDALGPERFALPKELAVHAAASGAAIACLAGGRAFIDRRLAPPLFAALALAAASYAASEAPAWEAARTAGLLASCIVAFLCARAVAASHQRQLACGILAVVVALAAAAILEAHGALALSPVPPGGLLGNRNALAHLVALALPLAIAVALSARHRLGIAATTAALAIAAHALVLTRCRAAWLAVAAAAVVGLALATSRARPRLHARHLACALALAAGATTAVAVPNRLAWTDRAPYRDTLRRLLDVEHGSGHGRLVQYRATLAMAAAHPWLGVGPGNWSARYLRHAAAGDPSYDPTQLLPVSRLPSSDWLGLLASLGAPALAALAACAAGYAALAHRRRATAALATLAALAVLGAADTVLGRAAPALVAALALGALLPATPVARMRRATAVAAVAALGAALAAAALGGALHSARLVAAGIAFDDGDPAELEVAARIAPGSMYFPTFLASHLLRHGHCARGAALAAGVLADYPHLVALRALAHACESTANHLGEIDVHDDQATDHPHDLRGAGSMQPRARTRPQR